MKDRTLDQNAAQWRILGAWAKQKEWLINGKKTFLHENDWKDILTATYEGEIAPRLAPGLAHLDAPQPSGGRNHGQCQPQFGRVRGFWRTSVARHLERQCRSLGWFFDRLGTLRNPLPADRAL